MVKGILIMKQARSIYPNVTGGFEFFFGVLVEYTPKFNILALKAMLPFLLGFGHLSGANR